MCYDGHKSKCVVRKGEKMYALLTVNNQKTMTICRVFPSQSPYLVYVGTSLAYGKLRSNRSLVTPFEVYDISQDDDVVRLNLYRAHDDSAGGVLLDAASEQDAMALLSGMYITSTHQIFSLAQLLNWGDLYDSERIDILCYNLIAFVWSTDDPRDYKIYMLTTANFHAMMTEFCESRAEVDRVFPRRYNRSVIFPFSVNTANLVRIMCHDIYAKIALMNFYKENAILSSIIDNKQQIAASIHSFYELEDFVLAVAAENGLYLSRSVIGEAFYEAKLPNS